MTNEYRPRFQEILGQMCKDIPSGLARAGAAVGMSALEFSINTIFGGVFVGTMPYYIPTLIRRLKGEDYHSDKSPESGAEKAGFYSGMILGVGSLMVQLAGYLRLAEKGHPEIFALPILTNGVSGIYEWQRSARERLKREKHGKQ